IQHCIDNPICSLHVVPITLSSCVFTHSPSPATFPLSLHDALPISRSPITRLACAPSPPLPPRMTPTTPIRPMPVTTSSQPKLLRSEEHTSELQSHLNLVCRLLLEKKKKKTHYESENTADATYT